MLNSGFTRICDPRQVHILIGFNNKLQVLRRFGDERLAMGEVQRQNTRQFFLKLHFYIMPLR